MTYTVKAGDTLTKIAKVHKTTVEVLLAANPTIKNKNSIAVGQKIFIPANQTDIPHNADTHPQEPTAVEKLLQRARSAMGKKIIYKLGGGTQVPDSATPQDNKKQCDCSGFTDWCLGLGRKTEHPVYRAFNGGWINTDGMVNDATKSTGFFTKLNVPRIGCLIIYPKNPKRSVGHVGIVSALNANGTVKKVIHCSSSNYRNTGDAIQETAPTVFQIPATIYIWFDGISSD